MRLRGATQVAGALVVAALAAGLLAPAAAAEKSAYAGPLLGPPPQENGSGVSFKVESGRKGPVAVRKFRFTFLIVSCSQGELQVSSSPGDSPTIPLRKGKFSFSFTDKDFMTDMKYEIRGRIPSKGPPSGTIKVVGSYTLPDTGPSFCDSTSAWTARPIDPNYL